MNEEENQAIKELEDFHKGDYFCDVILNLIEKQQKEIEELEKEKRILIETYTDVVYECGKRNKEIADLKMQNNILRDMNLTVRLSEEVFDETYISKDKIKEKIELLKDIKKANCYKQLTEDYIKGSIEQLEELLGE